MSRHTLAAVGVVVLVSLAGCSVITGEGPLSLTASEATVSETALSETGYESRNVSERSFSRTVSALGQTREVELTTHAAVYERPVTAGGQATPAAGFVVLSTPGVEVSNRTLNPLSGLSPGDLVQVVETGYDGVSVGDGVATRNVTVLGQPTTVTRFEGAATADGTEAPVTVHATTVEHEGDFLIAVAVHPTGLPGETARVDTLLAGLVHAGGSGSDS